MQVMEMQVMEPNMTAYHHQICSVHLLQNFLKDAKNSQQNCTQILMTQQQSLIMNRNSNEQITREGTPVYSFSNSVIDYQKKAHENLRNINENLSQMLQESFAGIDSICNKVRMCMLESNTALPSLGGPQVENALALYHGDETIQCNMNAAETTKEDKTENDEYVIIEENFSQTTTTLILSEIYTTDTETQTVNETSFTIRKRTKRQKKRVKQKQDKKDKDIYKNNAEEETTTYDDFSRQSKRKNKEQNRRKKKYKNSYKPFFTSVNSPEPKTAELSRVKDLSAFDDVLNEVVAKIQMEIRSSYADINNKIRDIRKALGESTSEIALNTEADTVSQDIYSRPETRESLGKEEARENFNNSLGSTRVEVDLLNGISDDDYSDNNIRSIPIHIINETPPTKDKPILEKLIYAEADVYRKRACTNLFAKLLQQIEANDSYIFFQKIMGECKKNFEEEEKEKALEREKQKEKEREMRNKLKKRSKANLFTNPDPASNSKLQRENDDSMSTKKRKKCIPKAQSYSRTQSKSSIGKSQKQEDLSKKYEDSLWFKNKMPTKRKKRQSKIVKSEKTLETKQQSEKSLKVDSKTAKSSSDHAVLRKACQITVTNDKQMSPSDKCKMYWLREKYRQLLQNQEARNPDLLDKITPKDIQPLKSEYPCKDKQHPFRKRLTDTYLYKMMFGNKQVVENAWAQLFNPAPSDIFEQFQRQFGSANSFLKNKDRKKQSRKDVPKSTKKPLHRPLTADKQRTTSKAPPRSEIVKTLSKYMFPNEVMKIINDQQRVYTVMPVHVYYDNYPTNQRRESTFTPLGSPQRDAGIKLPLAPMKETRETVKKGEWTTGGVGGRNTAQRPEWNKGGPNATGGRINQKPMRVVIDELPRKLGRDGKLLSARDEADANKHNNLHSSGSWCPKNTVEKSPIHKPSIHKTQSLNVQNGKQEKPPRGKCLPKPSLSRQDTNVKPTPVIKVTPNPKPTCPTIKPTMQDKTVKNLYTSPTNNLYPLKSLEGSLKSLTQQLNAAEGSLKNLAQYHETLKHIPVTNAKTRTRPSESTPASSSAKTPEVVPGIVKRPTFRHQIRSSFGCRLKPTEGDPLNLEAYGRPKMTEQERKIWQNKYNKGTAMKLVKFIENQPSQHLIPMPKHALPKETTPKSTVRQEQVLQHLQSLKHKNDAIQSNIQKAIDVIEHKMVDILSKPDLAKNMDAFDEMEKEVSTVLNMMKVTQKKQKAGENVKSIDEVNKISDELFKKLQNILDCGDATTNSSSITSVKDDVTTTKRKKRTVKKPQVADQHLCSGPSTTSAEEKCCVTNFYSPKKRIKTPKSAVERLKPKLHRPSPRKKDTIVNLSLIKQNGPAGDEVRDILERKPEVTPQGDQGDYSITRSEEIDEIPVKVGATPRPEVVVRSLTRTDEESEGNEDAAASPKPQQKGRTSLPLRKDSSNGPHKKEGEMQTLGIDPNDTEAELLSVTLRSKDDGVQTSETESSLEKEPKSKTMKCCATSTEDFNVEETFATCGEDENCAINNRPKSRRGRTETEGHTPGENEPNEESKPNEHVKTFYHSDLETNSLETAMNNRPSSKKEEEHTRRPIHENEDEKSSEDEMKVEEVNLKHVPVIAKTVERLFEKYDSADRNFYDSFSKIIMRAEDVYSKLNEFEIDTEISSESHTTSPENNDQPAEPGNNTSRDVTISQEKLTVGVTGGCTTPPQAAIIDDKQSTIAENKSETTTGNDDAREAPPSSLQSPSVTEGDENKIESSPRSRQSPRLTRSPSYYNVINFLETLTDEKPLESYRCVDVHYSRLCCYAVTVQLSDVSYQAHIENVSEYTTASGGCLKNNTCCQKPSKSQHRVSFKLDNDNKGIQTSITTSCYENTESINAGYEDNQERHARDDNSSTDQSEKSLYQDARDVHTKQDGFGIIAKDDKTHVTNAMRQQSLTSSATSTVNKPDNSFEELGDNSDQKTDISLSLDDSTGIEHCKGDNLGIGGILSGTYNKGSIERLKIQKSKSYEVKKRDSLEKILQRREITNDIVQGKLLLTLPPKTVSEFLDIELLKTAVEKRQKLRMLRSRKNSVTSLKKTETVVVKKPEEKENLLKGFYVMVYILMFTALNFDYKCL